MWLSEAVVKLYIFLRGLLLLAGDIEQNPGPLQAEEVLKEYRDRFIAVIDANAVVNEFLYKGIIPEGVQRNISKTYSRKEQNEILHTHLLRTCTNKELMTACGVITSVEGNSRMSALGKDMQRRLESEPRRGSESEGEKETTQASFGDLFGKYEEAKSEVSRLQDEVAQYKKDMELKDAEVVHAVEQHTESVAKYDQLWQENQELQQALAEVKRELGDCQKSLDGVQRTNRALALEKQDAIHRCGQLRADLQKLQKEKEAKDKALAENDKKLKALNGTVRDLSSKDTTSGRTINMLRHEVETLKQQLSRTQAEKRQADGDLVSVRKECRQTKESLEDCKEKLGTEMKSSKILQKQLEEKQEKLAAMDGKLGDKEEELIQLHADRQKKERKVDDQATAIQSLQLKLKQLQEQVDQWQKQCHSVSAELEEAKAAKGLLEESKSKLEDEKSACENRIQRLQGRLEGKEEDMNKKQKEYNQLLAQYHDVKTQFDEGKEQLPGMEQQIEDLEKEKRELERQLLGAQKTERALSDELRQHRVKLKTTEDKLKDVQRREQDLNDQLQLYHNQLEATKVALQVERDKLHSTEESVCQKEKEVEKLKGDLQSERDKVQTLEEAALQKERELDQCKARKAAVEKDLVRARKMAKDLLDERVVVNAESEQKRENLNERLMEFKQQAVLSEERLKQVQGLEGEHQDLKVQLKTLMTTLEDFQKVLTDEQKSRKSLNASVKALTAEIDQLRTELKERDNEVSSLAAANKHLQRKVDAADANSGEMKAEITQLRTELKERDNKVSSLTAANGGLQRKVDAADANITEMKAKSTSLKKQVKSLSHDKKSLKETLDSAEAAIQKHKNDYEDCQEKLREAEQQVALFQGKRQQLEVLESVAVELKTRLGSLMMDAPPSLTPSVSVGEDGASAVALTQEAAQKVQLLERERDSLKAERHMYQMKWLAAEDMLEAVKSEKQSLEVSLELSRLALRGAKVHLQVTEQSLQEEYEKKYSKVMKSLLQEQEKGGAWHPPEGMKLDALMDICRYYKDERCKEMERAAADKQCILASKKEADERVEAMACKIAALKECIEMRDGEIKRIKAQLVPHKMGVAPVPLPSDVVDVTGDEALLQRLCYMATGIKELLIGPDGGTFSLGSGDASLVVPPDAVEKYTSVRYAIILHGPFLFPTGYKTSSVLVYINMDGAVLKKAIILFLSHWCKMDDEDVEDPVKFFTAPHSVEVGQNYYEFKEQDGAEFSTTSAILSITEPQCLHCVRMKKKKQAVYNALCFKKCEEDVGTLFFKIQLMCDSSSWNEKMREELNRNGWKEENTNHSKFSFARQKVKEIHTEPEDASGPGWEAAVNGQHSIGEEEFLEPTTEMDKEVHMERFPPSISYKVVYTYPHLRSANPKYTTLKINMAGTNKKVTFGCRIEEGETELSVSSPTKSGTETPPSSLQAKLDKPADVIEALSPQLDSEWRAFGSRLRVKTSIMDSIEKDKAKVGERMLQLVEKWLDEEDQTGNLPRTWETVVQVVRGMGKVPLAKQLAEKHEVQLSGQ